MKRFALLLTGTLMLGTAVGCHCLHQGCGWGACGYGGGLGNPCGPAGCPNVVPGTPGTFPGGTTIPPQGAYHGSYDTMQATTVGASPVMASQPTVYTAGYPRTASTPREPLPTY